MKITIMTAGGRGDIQPYFPLAKALQERGHTVQMAVSPDFETLVAKYGLDFHPLGRNIQALLAGELQSFIDNGKLWEFVKWSLREIKPMLQEFNRQAWTACQGTDLIIYTSAALIMGSTIAEKLKVPCVKVHLQPNTPTAAFPFYALENGGHLGAFYNRFSWLVGTQLYWRLQRSLLNSFRQELGLKPLGFNGLTVYEKNIPVLCPYSPLLLPRPVDWPENVSVTGYWTNEAEKDWTPPPALSEFLAAGAPPVYLGFGSMIGSKAKQTFELVLKALELSGLRAIIMKGWGGLQNDESSLPHVFSLESVPHEWLFPRVAGVVHHAGVGTVGAALRAGVPQISVPFMSDQPFWARRVYELGCSPKPIPHRQLTAEKLARSLTQITSDKKLQERAALVARQIHLENGVEQSLSLILAERD